MPGHIHLDKISDAVKASVRLASGTSILILVIGVCDGIAMRHSGMNYSLGSHKLICLDGLVLVPNYDKIVPGMIIAAARLDIPAILL